MKRWTVGRCMRRLETRGSLMFLAAVVALGGNATPQQLDGIVAVVNDDIILASELIERFNMIDEQLRNSGPADELPPRDVIMEQLMERLIIESLQLQEADRRGVQVDDETLTTAVRSFAEQNQMSIEDFIDSLESEGMSYLAFREDVKRSIILQRIQQAVVNRRIYITEEDIKELIASPFFQDMASDDFRLGHIMLPLGRDASSQAVRAAERVAESIVRRVENGEDFRALAVAHSKASTALEGGDLGWRKSTAIPSLFAEYVQDMMPGEVMGPIRNSSGLHVITMLDRRGASQQFAQETLVRHILMRPTEIRTLEETLAILREIREEIIADDASFADLAAEHSDDPGTALAGGDLGWSMAGDFVPAFRDVMQNTEKGEVSEIFESEFGWHFLQVVDRREESRSDQALEDIATKMILDRRFDEQLQEWIREIRDEAFVEIRTDFDDELGEGS